jgi:hypothetical protein
MKKKMNNTVEDVCPFCEDKTSYSKKYDAFYCYSCHGWTTSQCSDPDCEYCVHRPSCSIDDSEN